jgi:hypothetical protein
MKKTPRRIGGEFFLFLYLYVYKPSRMKIPYSLFIFFLSLSASAQLTFQKTFGDTSENSASAVIRTADGGYVIGGTTFRSGVPNPYVIKTDSVGDTIWVREISVGGYGNALEGTADGNYILWAGNFFQFGSTLIKISSSGDTLWTRVFFYQDYWTGIGASVTSDSGYILTGGAFHQSLTSPDIFVTKTDAQASVQWSRIYAESNLGPYYGEGGYDVKQTADSGYIIAGYSTPQFGIPFGYLMKTNSAGALLWRKRYFAGDTTEIYTVKEVASGGYILAGRVPGFGAGDMYLIRTNATGDTLWTKTYGGAFKEAAASVYPTADGGFVVAGYTESFGNNQKDVYVVKTDMTGNLEWSHAYGGIYNDEPSCIRQADDGGFIVAGYTQSFGAGNKDVYLLKLDSLGNSNCNMSGAATVVQGTNTVVNTANLVAAVAGAGSAGTGLIVPGATVNELCSTVSVKENIIQNDFLIYPNPAHNTFSISFSQESGIRSWELEIYDVTGRMVHQQSIRNLVQSEIRNSFSPGIYLVRVEAGEKMWTEKLVVE